MMKTWRLTDTLALTASLLILIGAAWIALKGPTAPIPMHFDINGNADRYGTRYELAGALALMAVLNLFVSLVIRHQTVNASDAIRAKGLRRGQLMTVMIVTATAAYIPYASLGPAALTGTADLAKSTAFLSLVVIGVGAVLGRVGPNRFIGVRTPWAYRSRLAWDRSNRLAGRLYLSLGLAALAGLLVLEAPALLVCLVTGILCASLWAAYESWRVWRADPEARKA